MKLFDYLDKSDQKLPVLVNLVTPQGPEGWIYKQTGKVDRYASLIRTKSPTKWDAQLTESNFQTHPSPHGISLKFHLCTYIILIILKI